MPKSRKNILPRNLDRSVPFIRVLAMSRKNENKSKILKQFPPFVTDDIVEILYNIVTGQLQINPKSKSKLSKYQKSLIHVMNLRNNNQRRQYLYRQKGGFLSAVLPLLATTVGGLVSGIAASQRRRL